MRLRTDTDLRDTLYGLYKALFDAKRACPQDFQWGRLTNITTSILSVENDSWRVIGITKEALRLLATKDFNKNKLSGRLCRGHRPDRVETTRALFDREEPMPLEGFVDTVLQNDCTVIMLKEQNHKPYPAFIGIDNPDATRFPNAHIGWKDRKEDREYLRQLHALEAATSDQ